MPAPPAHVLDMGYGTGTLTLLLAEMDYSVTGADFSVAMLEQAAAKAQAAGRSISFELVDAAAPNLAGQRFDVVLCRHVLWALPDSKQALARWAELLAPDGCLVLMEGYWQTGGGLHVDQIVDALPEELDAVLVTELSQQPLLWGGAVTDERYLVVAGSKPRDLAERA